MDFATSKTLVKRRWTEVPCGCKEREIFFALSVSFIRTGRKRDGSSRPFKAWLNPRRGICSGRDRDAGEAFPCHDGKGKAPRTCSAPGEIRPYHRPPCSGDGNGEAWEYPPSDHG